MNMPSPVICLASCLLAVLLAPPPAMAAADDEKKILYWVAPMDANYRRDKPGKSPMGMDLVPVYADAAGSGGGITIAPEVVQNLGVRTAVAERSRLWRGIDTVGYVGYDESKVSHIHLRTEGWIENLVVESEGERVTQGQRLFDLYSPELVNAQEEFVQALKLGNSGLVRASRSRLEVVRFAGKTGTAQVVRRKADDEAEETLEQIPYRFRDHALFVSYAPAEDPKIAVAVIVENGGHGSSVAAPIARRIMDCLLPSRCLCASAPRSTVPPRRSRLASPSCRKPRAPRASLLRRRRRVRLPRSHKSSGRRASAAQSAKCLDTSRARRLRRRIRSAQSPASRG